MLKSISPLISPELLYLLAKMGHGDQLVIADGNFPADACAQRIVRADGHGATALLDAILKLFPVDDFVDDVAVVMQPVDPHQPEPPIWSEYRRSIAAAEGRDIPLTPVERQEFYRQAKAAYAIVATGETALYGNLMLRKGVIR